MRGTYELALIDRVCPAAADVYGAALAEVGRAVNSNGAGSDVMSEGFVLFLKIDEHAVMVTYTIQLDDDLARDVEESARRENKSVSEWFRERARLDCDHLARLAAMETQAIANGYPPGWLTLFGSLADDERFVAPARSATRPSPDVNP